MRISASRLKLKERGVSPVENDLTEKGLPETDDWIPVGVAATLLGVTRVRIHQLAKEEFYADGSPKLRMMKRHKRMCYVYRPDVDKYIVERNDNKVRDQGWMPPQTD